MKSEVYNIDCLKYMRGLPDKHFDLAIADPPYWAPDENTGRIRTTGNKQSSLNLGEKMGVELYEELKRISKAQIIWGANNYGFPFKGFIVWDKTNIPDEFTMSKCEIASVSENLSRVSKLFRGESTTTGTKRIHPTQKPIALYAWILKTYGGGGKNNFRSNDGFAIIPDCLLENGIRFCGLRNRQRIFRKRLRTFQP